MSGIPFPTPASWPLPTEALRRARTVAPVILAGTEALPEQAAEVTEDHEALAERISQEIARRARQRRYTG